MKFSLFLPKVFQNLKKNTCTSSCTPTYTQNTCTSLERFSYRKALCIKIIMHLTEYGAHLPFLFVLLTIP